MKHVDPRTGGTEGQHVQKVSADLAVHPAVAPNRIVAHDALHIARFGVQGRDVGLARVDDEGRVILRGVGDPADGVLVGDGDCLREGDFQARVGDVEEGGAGAA